jgi:hypothetical protein
LISSARRLASVTAAGLGATDVAGVEAEAEADVDAGATVAPLERSSAAPLVVVPGDGWPGAVVVEPVDGDRVETPAGRPPSPQAEPAAARATKRRPAKTRVE